MARVLGGGRLSEPLDGGAEANVGERKKTGVLSDCVGQETHPRVVVALLQAAEAAWGAEREIANDVESGVVEPVAHIQGDGGGLLDVFSETLDQEVHVGADEGRLFGHGARTESVGELSTQGTVFLASGVDDVSWGVDEQLVEAVGLGELLLAGLLVAIDVLPGLGAGVGELIGRNAYNGAVFPVEVADVECEGAVEQMPGTREVGGPVRDGTGESIERM